MLPLQGKAMRAITCAMQRYKQAARLRWHAVDIDRQVHKLRCDAGLEILRGKAMPSTARRSKSAVSFTVPVWDLHWKRIKMYACLPIESVKIDWGQIHLLEKYR